MALSERVSGRDLDQFFQTWLYTPQNPPAGSSGGVRGGSLPRVPPVLSLPLSNSWPFHLLREA